MTDDMSMSQASSKEVELVQKEMLPTLSTGKDLHSILKNAELQIQAQDSITKMALRVTSIADWIDQSGSPYLEYDGTKKVARLFGVSVRNVMGEKIDMKDEKGEYYVYQYSGEADWNGNVTPEIGVCTSRDKFFGQRSGTQLPQSEVSIGNVMKKAHTNLMNRAIKSKLGLSFTWDEISGATDNRITREKCTGVSYNKGTKGGSTAPAQNTPEQNDKRKEIWGWILEFVGGDIQQAQDTLFNLTQFKGKEGNMVGGRNDISKVSDGALKVLYPKIKAEIEAYRNSMQGGE